VDSVWPIDCSTSIGYFRIRRSLKRVVIGCRSWFDVVSGTDAASDYAPENNRIIVERLQNTTNLKLTRHIQLPQFTAISLGLIKTCELRL
jgi:hypothetical protein